MQNIILGTMAAVGLASGVYYEHQRKQKFATHLSQTVMAMQMQDAMDDFCFKNSCTRPHEVALRREVAALSAHLQDEAPLTYNVPPQQWTELTHRFGDLTGLEFVRVEE